MGPSEGAQEFRWAGRYFTSEQLNEGLVQVHA